MEALLLNSTFEPIGFVGYKKSIKLALKDKVDIISEWDENMGTFGKLPAIVRLKKYVKFTHKSLKFNRRYIFLRDNFLCQYCGQACTYKDITIDHILPRSRGGGNTWTNCVASCVRCNLRKSNRTPEEADMKLLSRPYIPKIFVLKKYSKRHPDWDDYLD